MLKMFKKIQKACVEVVIVILMGLVLGTNKTSASFF